MAEERMLITVALEPDSRSAETFREALAQAGLEGVALRFAGPHDLASAVREAEVLVAWNVPEELLAAAKRLRWVSFLHAGLDRVHTQPIVDRGIVITNASGVHGRNIAEHVLGMMLMFTRRLHVHLRQQLRHAWVRHDESDWLVRELGDQTLLIVGLGRIGETLAHRAKAFGMRVVGVKRDPSQRHDSGGAVDAVVGLAELERVLPEADHVCIALPLTAETRHLFDARLLRKCKPSAHLYNIARGAIVDEEALIAALQDGTIAGAGLDVFEEEPLPVSSPLWDLDNVIITPHVSGLTTHYFHRVAALFVDNLRRYLAGQPLLNRFEPSRGY